MNQKVHIMNHKGEGSISSFSGTTTASSKPTYMSTVTTATKSTEDDVVSLSLLYNLSTIQDKVHQIQSLVSFYMISNNNNNQSLGSTSLDVANIGSLVQEIITAASSMMFTCQQLQNSSNNNNNNIDNNQTADEMVMEFSRPESEPDHDFMQHSTNVFVVQERGHISFPDQNLNRCNETLNPKKDHHRSRPISGSYEILELDVADLLAKYTHYCEICGKGFKRDANLRMHMRAHGDEYKTREALIRPHTNHEKKGENALKKHYYSCPQQGCRWNQRHEKFQPLKSVICAKNHYKRSHCPKMYMCRRCSVKHFSVLSDLRTHEKHCGDLKWVCSCGTKFSRKDKLMSHVSLFSGHQPVQWPVAAADHHSKVKLLESSSS